MMKFLRSQSQSVLVVVLAVIALGFLFYGNAGNLLTTGSGRTSTDFGRIDGNDLSLSELIDAVHNTRDAILISSDSAKLRQPGAAQQVAEEAWRQLLLQHEADKLRINVSPEEFAEFAKAMPLFQDKNGAFSLQVYNDRMKAIQQILRVPDGSGADPLVPTKALIEQILRNEIRTNALSGALFGSARGSSHDVADQYAKYNGPATVTVITFDPKTFVATAVVTPAEIENEYKKNPMNPDYRTKEKRKVDFVMLSLTPEQAKLPAAEKAKAKDELGQKALEFALSLQPEPTAAAGTTAQPVTTDFTAAAKKAGLDPKTTEYFAEDSTPAGMKPSPTFNSTAFGLSNESSVSKVTDLDDGVVVVHLSDIQPSELRPLAEVKDSITKTLQQSKGEQNAELAAKAASDALKASVAKGTDFKAAAAALKLKADTLAPFVPMKVSQTNDLKTASYAYGSISLKPGEVSSLIPAQDGTLAVLHLDGRAQPDPAGLADFAKRYQNGESSQLRQKLYVDWANWKSKQPGTHRPPELERFGAAE